MTILDILNQIAATDSTIEKQRILEANKGNEVLKQVFRMAYHPRLQYGIKKIPVYDNSRKIVNCDLETTMLKFLENDLATRVFTGNTAISALAQKLSALQPEDAIVAERIIKRDLDCGAGATIANKVWKGLIPKQPQMLATAMSAKALEAIKFPAYAQLKADGARCFAEIRGDAAEDVKFLSRAGNEYQGLDSLKYELIAMTRAYREKNGPCMVDGELVFLGIKPAPKIDLENLFDESLEIEKAEAPKIDVAMRAESNGIANKSLKGTINKAEAAAMSFQVWDLVPLECLYGTDKSDHYSVRFADLLAAVEGSTRVFPVESQVVNNIAEARAIYKSYVEQGLEGIILKNLEGVWENKRSKNQVKFKEEITIDLRVVGVIEHSKDSTKLGALMVRSDDNLIRAKVGSGFTDTNATKVKGEWIEIPYDELDELNRTKLMNEADDIIGKIVEMKCNGWITAEGRKDYVSLFLPIILRFRDDKDETSTVADMFPEALQVIEV